MTVKIMLSSIVKKFNQIPFLPQRGLSNRHLQTILGIARGSTHQEGIVKFFEMADGSKLKAYVRWQEE